MCINCGCGKSFYFILLAFNHSLNYCMFHLKQQQKQNTKAVKKVSSKCRAHTDIHTVSLIKSLNYGCDELQ